MMRFSDEHWVNTPEKLEALDARLMDGETPQYSMLAFDTETNGLKFFRNVIIGFSISPSRDEGYYIPLLNWVPDPASEKLRTIDKVKRSVFENGHFECVWTGTVYPEDVSPSAYQPPELIVALVRRWLTAPGVRLLMWNAPFDCNMMSYNFGIDLAEPLWCDGILLKHAVNENTKHGLKETASQWKTLLGFNPDEDAKAEQKELGETVIRNGGTFNQRTKHIWRGDPFAVAKYAAADTALTFGAVEAGLELFIAEFGEAGLKWFFEDEVMPVCKEVVIPMRYLGVYIDVPYFERLATETRAAMNAMEDEIIAAIAPLIEDFTVGQSMEEAVSRQRFVKRLIELEGLEPPKVFDKKENLWKPSLAKKAVEQAYQANLHWLWGYLLGHEELKYSPERVQAITQELYMEVLGRRHRFNIRSADHLRWLFCDKLGYSRSKLPQTDSATPDNPIPSMAAEVIEEHFLKAYPFCQTLLKYKKLDKLLGTYIEAALELHNKGWLHMDMLQHGTTSGRFSCSGGFNLQTLPKVEELDRCPKCESKQVQVTHTIALLADLQCTDCGHKSEGVVCPSAIKAGFIAPPGYKIINADYSSLEPRCFAVMSGDSKIKEIFWKDLDMYSKVYCDMVDPEGTYSADPKAENFLKKRNKAARDLFKPVVLGIPYGALAPQVANLMNLKILRRFRNPETGLYEEREVLDVDKGREYRDLYLKTYPDLARYMQECELEAVSKGFVSTIVGRRRRFIYTQFVYGLLTERNIAIEDFLDAPYKSLNGQVAMSGSLDRDAFNSFCERYGLSEFDATERGGWAYIRELFKNELNNAKNVRIQGLAAHITNKGMLETCRSFRRRGIDGYVALQVHDEITSYARVEQAEEAAACQREAMERNQYTELLDVPMIAEPVVCDSLRESK